jgi:hypothetical protein
MESTTFIPDPVISVTTQDSMFMNTSRGASPGGLQPGVLPTSHTSFSRVLFWPSHSLLRCYQPLLRYDVRGALS